MPAGDMESLIMFRYLRVNVLEDHEGRKALWEQLQFALDGEPDPWFDFKEAAVDTRQFAALPA
jgi:nitrite reductase (NADH) large subunit